VGCLVGFFVGFFDGFFVGLWVGFFVGCLVGFLVGATEELATEIWLLGGDPGRQTELASYVMFGKPQFRKTLASVTFTTETFLPRKSEVAL
jgi:hypothetical protein